MVGWQKKIDTHGVYSETHTSHILRCSTLSQLPAVCAIGLDRPENNIYNVQLGCLFMLYYRCLKVVHHSSSRNSSSETKECWCCGIRTEGIKKVIKFTSMGIIIDCIKRVTTVPVSLDNGEKMWFAVTFTLVCPEAAVCKGAGPCKGAAAVD